MSKENENKKAEAVVDGTNVQVNAEVKDAKPEETPKTTEKPAEKEKKPNKILGGLKKVGKWAWTGLVTAGAVGGTVLGVSNMIHMKNIQNPKVPTVPGPDPAGNAAIGTGTATGIGTGVGTDTTASNTFTGTDVF